MPCVSVATLSNYSVSCNKTNFLYSNRIFLYSERICSEDTHICHPPTHPSLCWWASLLSVLILSELVAGNFAVSCGWPLVVLVIRECNTCFGAELTDPRWAVVCGRHIRWVVQLIVLWSICPLGGTGSTSL